jgi:4-hydroxybenzoate polyprenyltransferase
MGKNLVVLVPLALGWRDVSLSALATALAMMVLLSIAASLTYLVNDMADLSSDRKHWSKRRRAFASGAIGVRSGLMIVGFALPVVCVAAVVIAPLAGVCLLFYVAVTLGSTHLDGSASRYSTLSLSVCCLQFASSSALPRPISSHRLGC